jgi:hypothetical protein
MNLETRTDRRLVNRALHPLHLTQGRGRSSRTPKWAPRRILAVASIVLLTASACSGGHSGHSASSATPTNSPASGAGKPGAAGTAPPPKVNPCTLVDKREAASALGIVLQPPRVAPLGPTCIYSSKSGKVAATLALEAVSITQLRSQMSKVQTSSVGNHQLYCGSIGQPVLASEVSAGIVLQISAPCGPAEKMAADAFSHLAG